jgi:CheY-like chemotaxis protein
MQPKFLILVVDDDPLLLDTLNRAAWRSFPNVSFIQIYSATEAIIYINELDGHGPNLGFLDIDLQSELTGFDFLRFLKDHAQAHLLPVIMLTNNQEPSSIDSAYLLGASSHVVKPESFEGWRQHLITLRLYWFSVVTIPPVRFQKLDYGKKGLSLILPNNFSTIQPLM